MKIANKISLSFLITALILTSIAAPIFYITARNNLENAIFAHLKTTARSRTRHIETLLEEHKQKVKILASDISFQNSLKAKADDNPSSARDIETSTLELKEALKQEKQFCEIFALNPDGEVVISTNESSIGLDKSTNAYFLGGKEGVYIKDAYYSKTTGKKAIAISTPILDGDTRKLLGVLVARLDLTILNEITTDRTGLGETGEIYLVNKEGYMITPSRFKRDTFLKQKVNTENTRAYFKDTKKYGRKPHPHEPLIYTDYRGIKVLGIHNHIYDMQWCSCAEIDEREALAPLAKIKILFVITMTFVPIAAWLIGAFVSRLISGPIHKLHKGTEVIGKGNLDYKVGTDAKDEIGQLSRAFDEMTNHLKQSTTSIDNLNMEITVRKKAEDTLRETTNYLESLINYANAPIIVWDKELRITQYNHASEYLTGYTTEEVTGQELSMLFPEASQDESLSNIERALSGEYWESVEIPILRKDGDIRVVLWNSANIYAKDGTTFLATIAQGIDITERKKAEMQLQAAQEKLIDTARQVGMAETATDVLHNVGNVLNSVSVTTTSIQNKVRNSKVSYLAEVVGLLEEHSDDLSTFITTEEQGRKLPAFLANLSQELITEQERYLEALETLTKHVEHMAEIIRLQQSYSKTTGMVEPASVVELVEDAIRINAEALTRHGVEVKRELADLPPILLDHHKVLQILTNLISNAKYALSDSNQDDRILTICVTEPQGGHFRIEVHDDGVGITEENLTRIFEHGFTTKKHGYGFGLHSAAIAAKEMNGSLTAHSDGHGKGTTFTIELPFQTQEIAK